MDGFIRGGFLEDRQKIFFGTSTFIPVCFGCLSISPSETTQPKTGSCNNPVLPAIGHAGIAQLWNAQYNRREASGHREAQFQMEAVGQPAEANEENEAEHAGQHGRL
jgi:hypothetical protein